MADFRNALLTSRLARLAVSFTGCGRKMSSESVELLAAGLPDTLREVNLDFHGCTQVGDKVLVILADGLKEMESLRILVLNFTDCIAVTDVGTKTLIEALTSDTLEEIWLDFAGCAHLGGDSVGALPPMIHEKTNLRSVHLDFQQIRAIGDRDVIPVIINLPFHNLVSLGLCFSKCSEITNSTMESLANALTGTRIQRLSLKFSGCRQLTHDGVMNVVAQFPSATLTKIELNFEGCGNVKGLALHKVCAERHPRAALGIMR